MVCSDDGGIIACRRGVGVGRVNEEVDRFGKRKASG